MKKLVDNFGLKRHFRMVSYGFTTDKSFPEIIPYLYSMSSCMIHAIMQILLIFETCTNGSSLMKAAL